MNKTGSKAAVCILFVFTGCVSGIGDITKPLFAVTEPVYKSASSDDRCMTGGVYFDFYNRADCSVTYIETRMNVYDRRTLKNAFTGFGPLESGNRLLIRSGEKKQLCVSLDDYITAVSSAGYYIDQFYVSRIEYENGSVWTDDFGVYALSSKD